MVRKLLTKEALEEVRTIAIYGEIGEGKTSLAYTIIEKLKQGREVFFLKYPNPEIINKLGYESLDSLELIENMEDCILYIDEPQLHFGIYDKKSNGIIAKICSLARQKNIILIISTSDTRVFTRHNESYFDAWCIKNLDYSMIKIGSKIRKIFKNNALFDPSGIFLNHNEFLFDRKCKNSERSKRRITSEFNGIYTFEEEDYFTEVHSKPYRQYWESKTPNESPNQEPNKTPNQNKTANANALSLRTKKDQENNSKKKFQVGEKESLQEIKGPKPAKKELTDEEVRKLAWGGGK